MVNLPNDFYVSNSNSTNAYTDTRTRCRISGNKLVYEVYVVAQGASNGLGVGGCALTTRSDTFYLSGMIAYE